MMKQITATFGCVLALAGTAQASNVPVKIVDTTFDAQITTCDVNRDRVLVDSAGQIRKTSAYSLDEKLGPYAPNTTWAEHINIGFHTMKAITAIRFRVERDDPFGPGLGTTLTWHVPTDADSDGGDLGGRGTYSIPLGQQYSAIKCSIQAIAYADGSVWKL